VSGMNTLTLTENCVLSRKKGCLENNFESRNHNSCKLPKKSSAFALSTTNIIPPTNGNTFSRNDPQQDENYQIEDDFLTATSKEADDKVCINCLFEYGDDDMWLKCSICFFSLHKHCSVRFDKDGTLICPPCSLKQKSASSGSYSKSVKKTVVFEKNSTSLLVGSQNSNKIVNTCCVSCNKREPELDLKVCNYCKSLVHSHCSIPQRTSWKCLKCFSEQSNGKGNNIDDKLDDKSSEALKSNKDNSICLITKKDKNEHEDSNSKRFFCPKCKKNDSQIYMIKCTSCNSWTHPKCSYLVQPNQKKYKLGPWNISKCQTCYEKMSNKQIYSIYDEKVFSDNKYKNIVESISNDVINPSISKNKKVQERLHNQSIHCQVCKKGGKKSLIECGFCKDTIHKLCGNFFMEGSAKAMKWHCPLCFNVNPIKYDPIFCHNMTYLIDQVNYECESQKYLTKEEEEELVLQILRNFYKSRIIITNFQTLLLSFVKSKDGPINQVRVTYDDDWKWRFMNRHPILKEIVSVKDIDNEVGSLAPKINTKKQIKEAKILADVDVKKEVEITPLKEREQFCAIVNQLPKTKSNNSSKQKLTGPEIGTEVIIKKEITEMESSTEQQISFAITNELRKSIQVEFLSSKVEEEISLDKDTLSTTVEDENSLDEETLSSTETLSLLNSIEKTDKFKQNNANVESVSSVVTNFKRNSLNVEGNEFDDDFNMPKNTLNQNNLKTNQSVILNDFNICKQKKFNYQLKCSIRCGNECKRALIKPLHEEQNEYNNQTLLIKLEKLPLELCETVEGRKHLVSRSFDKQNDDGTIACVGCETNSGSMNSWLGCDSCKSWWHIKCAGLPTTLTKRQIQEMDWYCPTCKKADELISRRESVIQKEYSSTKESRPFTKNNWPLNILNVIKRCRNCKNCHQILPCGICMNCKDNHPKDLKRVCEQKKCTNPQIRVKELVIYKKCKDMTQSEFPELLQLSKCCTKCKGCTTPFCGKCINCKRQGMIEGSKRVCIRKKCLNPIVELNSFLTCKTVDLNLKESVINALKCDQRFSLNQIPSCGSCEDCRKPNCGLCQFCQEVQFSFDKERCRIKHCMNKRCILTVKNVGKFIYDDRNPLSYGHSSESDEKKSNKMVTADPMGIFTMTEEAGNVDIDADIINSRAINEARKSQDSNANQKTEECIPKEQLSENQTETLNYSKSIDGLFNDDVSDLPIFNHFLLSQGNMETAKNHSDLSKREKDKMIDINSYNLEIYDSSEVLEEEDTVACEGCSRHEGSVYWICCDGCDGWWHRKCAGIAEDTTDEKIHEMLWNCPTCVAHAFLSANKGKCETSIQAQNKECGNKFKISVGDVSIKKNKGKKNISEKYRARNEILVDMQEKLQNTTKWDKTSLKMQSSSERVEKSDCHVTCNENNSIDKIREYDKYKLENNEIDDYEHCFECKTASVICTDYNDYYKILQKLQAERLKRKRNLKVMKIVKDDKSPAILEEKEISIYNISKIICGKTISYSETTQKMYSKDIRNSSNEIDILLNKSVVKESCVEREKCDANCTDVNKHCDETNIKSKYIEDNENSNGSSSNDLNQEFNNKKTEINEKQKRKRDGVIKNNDINIHTCDDNISEQSLLKFDLMTKETNTNTNKGNVDRINKETNMNQLNEGNHLNKETSTNELNEGDLINKETSANAFNEEGDLINKKTGINELNKNNYLIIKETSTIELNEGNDNLINKQTITNKLNEGHDDLINKETSTNKLNEGNDDTINKETNTNKLNEENDDLINKETNTNKLNEENDLINKETNTNKLNEGIII
ncbi:unnamed protein product, partial [Meganyctiphanes norvegica]